MHIFLAAALFLGGVVTLVYLRGRIVLRLLSMRLRGLEEVALAGTLGLLLSAIIYWMFARCGAARFYPLWPGLATAICLYLHWRGEDIRALADRVLAAREMGIRVGFCCRSRPRGPGDITRTLPATQMARCGWLRCRTSFSISRLRTS